MSEVKFNRGDVVVAKSYTSSNGVPQMTILGFNNSVAYSTGYESEGAYAIVNYYNHVTRVFEKGIFHINELRKV